MTAPIHVKGVRYPRPRPARPRPADRVGLVRARSLLWLPALGALVAGGIVFGTPHLRFAYGYLETAAGPRYTRCDYLGLHSRRVIPLRGHCPLILLLRAPENRP